MLDVTFIIDNHYTNCCHGNSSESFTWQIRSFFVPWALTDQALLDSILMTACNSLMTLCLDRINFRIWFLMYNSQCLSMVRQSLCQGHHLVDDNIIGISLMMATGEVRSCIAPHSDILARIYLRGSHIVHVGESKNIRYPQQGCHQNGQSRRRHEAWSWGLAGVVLSPISV